MGTVDIKGKGTMELSGGILRLSWKQGTYIGIDVATAALGVIETLCQGAQLPMLVEIGGVTHSAAARKVFPSRSNISRMALVGTSPKDRIIAVFRLPMAPAGFPIRYFTTKDKALEWLRDGSRGPA
ncbi:STAS/SEC14 domain-containing protein [Pseudarthrobacter sp902506025]|uniref:STAS/SEC14 domain-containing protein n=1 Tax=Pseudarthrobacter sp. 902506025 TaxID=3155291 RepID=UPI00344E7FA3